MKKSILVIVVLVSNLCFANGVGIVDATNAEYLTLTSSIVEVDVENQVGIIKSTNTFKNNFMSQVNFKYGFPLPEGASAISLRWYINGIWTEAAITIQPPDTTLPGGGDPDPNLLTYLGQVPLYFNIDDTLHVDSLAIFELIYVQFLPYSFGNVNFLYPNDYQLIQTSLVDVQHLLFSLNSSRTIENIQVLSYTPTQLINNGNYAFAEVLLNEVPADTDYEILYSLSLNELGLFSFSTFQPDSLVPDTLARGFFVFVAEPDPSNTDIIDKVFTLIVDRSGSMSGNKIVQARDAASFIVQNLNDGDKFNIVDFSSDVSSFRPEHVPYNATNEADALAYISTFIASGSTNISGAYDIAVPQFAVANDSTANIIIFFTDGQPTSGITNTMQLVAHINNLVQTTETEIMIFSFGIGLGVNQQLLTLISQSNMGTAIFLLDQELEEIITNFYLQIRNPVLLNTSISHTPNVLSEIYPDPLPNLYKGQQMIVSGRYNEAANVEVTLSGEAFGQPVEYIYDMLLSDSSVYNYQFLPKVWAKLKIEYLLIIYYGLDPNSPEAEEIKEQIIQLSIAYGVISPFTSFGNPLTSIEDEEINLVDQNQPLEFRILGNYPNPFNPSTTIQFSVGNDVNQIVKLKIYNSIGELVKILTIYVGDAGIYEIMWDGTLYGGKVAPSDVYIYVLDFGNVVLSNKMILLK
jgi:Ca-activated chloride channel family protein